jgi:glycosyltransferase involved in cell wall biosynthesis/predicted GH43/DUF377 family glycosyl hydrolase
MSPRLCINMIVKNEIANLPRCLNSAVDHICAAVIFDTGSTDGTPEFIKAECQKANIPCIVNRGRFENFEQARNLALKYAKRYHVEFDYILLMDADMELVVDGPLPELTAESYCLLQKQGGLNYHNVRLLRKNSTALYHGVTHEYLGVNEQELLPGDVWWFKDHATGSNRADKYARDKRLLEGYLAEHPNDGRSLFYLAQTYRDAGDNQKAIDLYRRRIDAGGWDEEIWYSRYQIAMAFKALGNEPEFISNALMAYNDRPSRAEPLHALARYFREKNNQQKAAWLFAEAGEKITYPGDMLFVDQWMYKWGFAEEKSILGSYVPGKRAEGAKACDKLSLCLEASNVARENARRNMYWYLDALRVHTPSFKAVRIPDVNSDKTYVNTNPSVAVVDGDLKAIVRTVSYRIRPDGSYDYNGLSAIRTTSFLVDLDYEFKCEIELKRPDNFPEPVFKEVLDVEDMRLIPHDGELWANGCVLEQNADAWREQFLMRLNPVTGAVTEARRIDPKFIPKQNEKNWMPMLNGGDPIWMYRPGTTMDADGNPRAVHVPALAVDDFSGGGQMVRMDAGWLGIVHTARPDPMTGKRYYWHRFVFFDNDGALTKASRPFVFFDKQIEFAAGLALFHGKVIVSFGVLDREAWIASIDEHEVRDLLWLS